VRATNLSLSKAQRIRVWLGEPPIDWSKISSKAEFSAIDAQRDSYPAGLIDREILGKNKKALVIYGDFHVLTDPILLGRFSQGRPTMGALIERRRPGAIFRVFTYAGGFTNAACTAEFEKHTAKVIVPALLVPIRGTALDNPSFRQRCPLAHIAPPASMPKEARAELINHMELYRAGVSADAMLYLGPSSTLTESPTMPDAYLDEGYMKEMRRRWLVVGLGSATPSNMGISVDKNGVSPKPFK
jgi:hypothetical protein